METTVSTLTAPGVQMHIPPRDLPRDVAIEKSKMSGALLNTTNRDGGFPKTTDNADQAAQSIQKENKPLSTRLFYLADLPLYRHTKPVQVVPGFAEDNKGVHNVELEAGPKETINDVRGREHEFTLEENGFRYLYSPTQVKDFASKDALETDYLRECERLLRREVEGVDEVVFFDARLRKSQTKGSRGSDGLSTNPFARQVHVDELETSIVTRIRSQTELKADFLLRGRVRVINIWRPVSHPVWDCALALTDTVGSSLTIRDVIECDRVRRDTGKFWDTMGVVQHRQGYKWYYMSEQTPDEPVMFMGYDSACTKRIARQEDVDGNPGFCFHTAFDIPEPYPEGWQPRESIEVRALVFTYPYIERATPLRNQPSPGQEKEKRPFRTRSFSYEPEQNDLNFVGGRGAKRNSRQGSRRDSMRLEPDTGTPKEQDEDMKSLMEELAALKAALNQEKSAREQLEAQVKALKRKDA
ncbi:hypothetical protein NA57DRAFT_81167 [Rhizodiscina lignyota]|uniref:Methyltransferase n=1 Tax=Rhizodiscina lignyota TaxID=1504668 RepID=A0A9P4I5R1_9PEZI|nr:hypothetical protein NA57DRAFT_81167 [Rhizodiscina lignyota]